MFLKKMTPTLIKICGVTNIEDAMMITELGADFIGFIFAVSPRRVSPYTAREIISQLPSSITTVGVFTDTPADEINQVAEFTGIDIVQLHGDESTEYCNKIKKRVIKRIKVLNNDTSAELITRMKNYRVTAYLLDPGAGSGKPFNWSIAIGINLPIIVAGGLTPDNVKDVIRLLRPYGVDVSSGVEQSPGKKDKHKVKLFIEQVRSCC